MGEVRLGKLPGEKVMALVSCSICNHFMPGAGSGQGIGRCKVFEAYSAKKPGKAAIWKALVSLGNKADNDIFYGGHLVDRQCSKYEAIK